MIKKYPDIKGYYIKKKLGQGGMASVFLGIDKKMHKMVAIKVFVVNDFGGQKRGKRFLKEARLLSKLNHPNIVNVLKVEKTGKYYFIVMEYLHKSLRDIIDSQKINPQDALKIVFQISEALFYLHNKGIVHRDVKPGNIMFRNDNTPVLLDFGIVKTLRGRETQLTETGTFIGTPYYMSPEQCTLQRIDGRSDIYSLGVVFYEMLRGRVPYRGKTPKEVFDKHRVAPPPRLPKSLEKIQELIDLMMAKDKKNRIRSQSRLSIVITKLLNDKDLMGEITDSFNTKKGKKFNLNRETIKSDIGRNELTSKGSKIIKAGKKKNRFKKNALMTLLIFVLIVLILKLFFGYTLKSIFITFLKIILYAFKMLVDLIERLFKREETNSVGILFFYMGHFKK